MNSPDTLVVAFRPTSAKWQLPTSATGQLAMVGWHLAGGRGVDGGVPPTVAGVLTRALTRSACLSFLDSKEPTESVDVYVKRLEASGLGAKVRAMADGLPRAVYLISTRRPEIAQSAFDASLFSWETQGQVLFLSSPLRPSPQLEWIDMLSITGRESPITCDVLRGIGVDALVFPGVDGDVAGVVSATSAAEARILTDLRAEAEAAGFAWRMVPEDDFIQVL
jgi:hypothetical protein